MFLIIFGHQIIKLFIVYLAVSINIRLVQYSLKKKLERHRPPHHHHLDLLRRECHPQVTHHCTQLLSAHKTTPILTTVSLLLIA